MSFDWADDVLDAVEEGLLPTFEGDAAKLEEHRQNLAMAYVGEEALQTIDSPSVAAGVQSRFGNISTLPIRSFAASLNASSVSNRGGSYAKGAREDRAANIDGADQDEYTRESGPEMYELYPISEEEELAFNSQPPAPADWWLWPMSIPPHVVAGESDKKRTFDAITPWNEELHHKTAEPTHCQAMLEKGIRVCDAEVSAKERFIRDKSIMRKYKCKPSALRRSWTIIA